jgi:hypothetical protein
MNTGIREWRQEHVRNALHLLLASLQRIGMRHLAAKTSTHSSVSA